MKKILAYLFIMTSTVVKGQEISKDKTTSIENIKAAGYEVIKIKDDVFGYTRYDIYGKTSVFYEHTGDIIRRVTFLPTDPIKALNRFTDMYGAMSLNEQYKATKGYHTNEMMLLSTDYYKGSARYSYEVNEEKKSMKFIIDIL